MCDVVEMPEFEDFNLVGDEEVAIRDEELTNKSKVHNEVSRPLQSMTKTKLHGTIFIHNIK